MFVGMYALIVAAIFCGAAIYINLVEHSARLSLEDSALLAEWKLAYRRGFTMQSSLALLSGILGILAYLQSNNYFWMLGAIFMLLNWPYTFIVIRPIVGELLKKNINRANQETRNMIIKWNRLHAVRSVLSFLAVVMYSFGLSKIYD